MSIKILRFSPFEDNFCEIVIEEKGIVKKIVAQYDSITEFCEDTHKALIKHYDNGRFINVDEFDYSEEKSNYEVFNSKGDMVKIQSLRRVLSNEKDVFLEDICTRDGICCAYLYYENGELMRAINPKMKDPLLKERISGIFSKPKKTMEFLNFLSDVISMILIFLSGYYFYNPNINDINASLLLGISIFVKFLFVLSGMKSFSFRGLIPF